jgi:hypothetical protein
MPKLPQETRLVVPVAANAFTHWPRNGEMEIRGLDADQLLDLAMRATVEARRISAYHASNGLEDLKARLSRIPHLAHMPA